MALVILSAAGLSVVGVLDAGLASERDARARERTLAAEDRILSAMTLLARSDLDQRIGRHQIGEFTVSVQRPERTLYRIAISDMRSVQVEDLVTVVYRREASHVP